jgi:cbb3-type cytochrome oxidase subunit 3
MKKLNQSGFIPLLILLFLVLIAVIIIAFIRVKGHH